MFQIPPFFSKKANFLSENDKHVQLQSFLSTKRAEMVSFQNEYLAILASLLEQAESDQPTTCWVDKTLSYNTFQRIGRDPRLPQDGLLLPTLFSPKLFFALPKNRHGSIYCSMLFDFALEYRAQRLMRIDLAEIDADSTGFLTFSQTLQFLKKYAAGKVTFSEMTQEDVEQHFFVAARKFQFLLQTPQHRISIPQLMGSPILQEFKNACKNQSSTWWTNSRDVLDVFYFLDRDQNGTLTMGEFMAIKLGGLNEYPSVSTFVAQRIFETCLQNREMTFAEFYDFVLANQHKTNENALRYFWRLLDLNNHGLTVSTVTPFLLDMQRVLEWWNFEYTARVGTLENVRDEIFDLFQFRENECVITWEEFKSNSKSACIVIDLLTDPNAFVDYDTREARMNQRQQQYEEVEQAGAEFDVV